MKNIFLLMLSCFLVSCGPGTSDYIVDLGNGYYYQYNDSFNKQIVNGNKIVINPPILDYKYTEDEIIVVAMKSDALICLGDNEKEYNFYKLYDSLEFHIVEKETGELRSYIRSDMTDESSENIDRLLDLSTEDRERMYLNYLELGSLDIINSFTCSTTRN